MLSVWQDTTPDLGSIITALAEDVETAMTSLYHLQTALVNAVESDQTGQIFKSLRAILKGQWDEVLGYLQRCHAFGADISMLKDALETERTDDRAEFLTDMEASAKELLEISEKLREKGSEVSVAFVKERQGLVEVLKASKSVKSAKPVKGDVPKARNDELQAFVDVHLAAVYPDGWKALCQTDDALVNIVNKFETICRFWKYTLERCQLYLTESAAGGHKKMPAQAEQMITDWKGYQEQIESAIVSVAKTNDAILVQAAAASGSTDPPTVSTASEGFFVWLGKKWGRFGRK